MRQIKGGWATLFEFLRKKRQAAQYSFDPETQVPVIHCSICTGEEVAGFKDKKTGHFTGVMLVRGEADLEEFKSRYKISDSLEKVY